MVLLLHSSVWLASVDAWDDSGIDVSDTWVVAGELSFEGDDSWDDSDDDPSSKRMADIELSCRVMSERSVSFELPPLHGHACIGIA